MELLETVLPGALRRARAGDPVLPVGHVPGGTCRRLDPHPLHRRQHHRDGGGGRRRGVRLFLRRYRYVHERKRLPDSDHRRARLQGDGLGPGGLRGMHRVGFGTGAIKRHPGHPHARSRVHRHHRGRNGVFRPRRGPHGDGDDALPLRVF